MSILDNLRSHIKRYPDSILDSRSVIRSTGIRNITADEKMDESVISYKLAMGDFSESDLDPTPAKDKE